MTNDEPQPDPWQLARRTIRRGIKSSLHCAIATVDPDGTPHVTPIGSVMLTGPGEGIYFDIYATHLSRSLDHDARIAVLALDSGRRFWLRSLIAGRLSSLQASD